LGEEIGGIMAVARPADGAWHRAGHGL